MRGNIQKIRAMGINMNKNKQENKDDLCFSEKSKKREKFSSAGRFGLCT